MMVLMVLAHGSPRSIARVISSVTFRLKVSTGHGCFHPQCRASSNNRPVCRVMHRLLLGQAGDVSSPSNAIRQLELKADHQLTLPFHVAPIRDSLKLSPPVNAYSNQWPITKRRTPTQPAFIATPTSTSPTRNNATIPTLHPHTRLLLPPRCPLVFDQPPLLLSLHPNSPHQWTALQDPPPARRRRLLLRLPRANARRPNTLRTQEDPLSLWTRERSVSFEGSRSVRPLRSAREHYPRN